MDPKPVSTLFLEAPSQDEILEENRDEVSVNVPATIMEPPDHGIVELNSALSE